MTRKEIDYTKTVLYKIVCNDLTVTDLYVGSTTAFTKRKNRHKFNCNNVDSKEYNYKVYQMIKANGGWCNWTMVEIEKFPCNDGNEARARERYWIELLNANMNIRVPGRTEKEWIEARKEWIEANKDKIKKTNKKYYINNKEKIKTYQRELRKLKKQDQKQ